MLQTSFTNRFQNNFLHTTIFQHTLEGLCFTWNGMLTECFRTNYRRCWFYTDIILTNQFTDDLKDALSLLWCSDKEESVMFMRQTAFLELQCSTVRCYMYPIAFCIRYTTSKLTCNSAVCDAISSQTVELKALLYPAVSDTEKAFT